MESNKPELAATGDESAGLSALLERVPDGWTRAHYNGRTYGLARTTRAGGRIITITAEELGGTDLVSANVYRTSEQDHLRACEMPTAKVIAFLRAWTPALVKPKSTVRFTRSVD
ncbi:MAG: hypothetical protein ACOH19_10270 [Rhodoglobus sp.]